MFEKRDFTGISCSGLLRPSALPSSQLARATYLYETTERTLALSMARQFTPWRGRGAILLASLLAIVVGHPRGALVSAQQGRGRKVGFNIQPKEGPASGGTLVTLQMNAADVPMTHAKWWCSFGEKRVPAQSFFMIPSEQHGGKGSPALLCVAPAGPIRGEASKTFCVKYRSTCLFSKHKPKKNNNNRNRNELHPDSHSKPCTR